MSQQSIKQHLLTLLDDYRDFNSSPISVQPIPTAVEFSKQVSKGYPCIYQAYEVTKDQHGNTSVSTDPSLLESPAFTWTKQDLLNLVKDKVEVAVTPNGRADDLAQIEGHEEPVFLAPATIEMTMSELLDHLESSPPSSTDPTNKDSPPVYYLQSQNSNLTTSTALAPIKRHCKQPKTRTIMRTERVKKLSRVMMTLSSKLQYSIHVRSESTYNQ